MLFQALEDGIEDGNVIRVRQVDIDGVTETQFSKIVLQVVGTRAARIISEAVTFAVMFIVGVRTVRRDIEICILLALRMCR